MEAATCRKAEGGNGQSQAQVPSNPYHPHSHFWLGFQTGQVSRTPGHVTQAKRSLHAIATSPYRKGPSQGGAAMSAS